MRVLVTGGAGYIGSVAVGQLCDAGHEVVVFDSLYQGHRAAVDDRAELVEGDLADRAAVERLFASHRPEGVMHFASHTLVGESMEKPFLYLGDNLRNGLNLLECAAEQGTKRFILSSTANLFGLPERVPIDEAARIDPGSPYGESKFILERMLRWMDDRFGMRYAALRYFNAAGAASPDRGEDHDPETHLVPSLLKTVLGQRDCFTMFGDDYPTPDGTCIRDYVHVDDLCAAHVLALERLTPGAKHIFNVGIGRGYSVRQIVESVERVTGKKVSLKVGPRRPGDPPSLFTNSDRLQAELGWKPAYTEVDPLIRTAWEWFKRHPSGYGPDVECHAAAGAGG